MKKFLLLLVMIPALGFSQTFDFTNSDDGWDVLGNFTASTNPTFYTLTTVPGNGTLNNPTCANETTISVNTADVTWVGITIRNNDANGPDFMRMSYPKFDGGRVYKNIDITTGDAEFVTYWLDLTNATYWVGTLNDFKLHFKAAGNTDYILPDDPISIDIDKIEFVAEIPATVQNEYYFDNDGDPEGFVQTNGTILSVAGGILTFEPNADSYAKLKQEEHVVDATNNKYVHITLKNNSPLNDQLRLVCPDAWGGSKIIDMSVNDVTEKTYTYDLTGEAGWTGELAFEIGIGSYSATNPGQAADNGTIEFNSIVFDNTPAINIQNEYLFETDGDP